jgi:hypothetical protein
VRRLEKADAQGAIRDGWGRRRPASAPAQAQHYAPAVPPRGVRGGCYWFRGHHYCNRYCYLEIDGYTYCQRRADAGSQAPPPVVVVPPPYGHRRPARLRFAPIWCSAG